MDDLNDTYTAILRELAERRDELVTHCRGEGYSGLDIHISWQFSKLPTIDIVKHITAVPERRPTRTAARAAASSATAARNTTARRCVLTAPK